MSDAYTGLTPRTGSIGGAVVRRLHKPEVSDVKASCSSGYDEGPPLVAANASVRRDMLFKQPDIAGRAGAPERGRDLNEA